MFLPNASPREGGQDRRTWSVLKVKPGTALAQNGWIAGPAVWAYTHYRFRSLPCHTELTGGKLECPYCKVIGLPKVQGYLPLYSEIGKPLIVVVQEYARAVVDRLPLYSPVRVRRQDDKWAQTVVEPARWTDKDWRPASGEPAPADVGPALLVIWKDAALINWFGKHQATSDNGLSTPPPVRQVAADLETAREQGAAELDKITRKVRERLKARDKTPPTIGDCLPSLNGDGSHGE